MGIVGEAIAAEKELAYRRTSAEQALQKAATGEDCAAFEAATQAAERIGVCSAAVQAANDRWGASVAPAQQELEATSRTGTMREFAAAR
jgi:hypothetical protein